MRSKYLRVMYRTSEREVATAISGPYTRLVRVAAYARRVMVGSEAFALWTSFSGVHPVSGAPCTMRERVLLNGRDVVSIEEVSWKGEGAPNIANPADLSWVRDVRPAPGEHGTLVVREPLATRLGVPAGTEFPVERVTLGEHGESEVIALNADASRVYSLTFDGIFENGVRLDPPALDEEDAAAAGIARAQDDGIDGFDGDDDEDVE